jgi:hypothetical protein
VALGQKNYLVAVKRKKRFSRTRGRSCKPDRAARQPLRLTGAARPTTIESYSLLSG